MDLNPVFTGSRHFRPSGDGGALALFEHAGITLVHGWLVDPDSPEYSAVSATSDYDAAAMLVAEADHLTHGQLVLHEDNGHTSGPSSSSGAGSSSAAAGPSSSSGVSSGEKTLTPEERAKVSDGSSSRSSLSCSFTYPSIAIKIRTFLDNTSSQLTYHGLFDLSSTVPAGQLIALFRNSHLNVLYKPLPSTQSASDNPFASEADVEADASTAGPSASSAQAAPNAEPSNPNTLYLLVTDSAFVREPSVVWEALRDVDGQTSSFFDSSFVPSRPVGGDFAGGPGAALHDEFAALSVADEHEYVLFSFPNS